MIKKMMEQGRRIDGRGLMDFRNLNVKIGEIKTADGSSMVSLGNTKVIAGIKLEIGQPFKDTPNEGALIVNLEMPPIASPTIEPGPPNEEAIEIARVVDRTIRHSGFLDLKSLAITPGKYVWILWIDLYVLNHDGNLIDASTIAAISALISTKIPKVEITESEVKIIKEEKYELKLDLEKLPLTFTYIKIGNSLILDPILEEEKISDGRYTIGIAGDRVVSIQKASGIFTIDDVKTILNNSLSLYKVLKEYLINNVFRAS